MSPVRLVGLVLVLFTLVLFSRARHFEFINFDDPLYVTENAHVQPGLTGEGLAWAFGRLHGEGTYWHPITWVSHMVDCQLFGAEAGGHHVVNVLLHAITALLLFQLLRHMTGALWKSAVVAALFAWHPLQVDTVAWVAERKNVLAGLFWVLTMLAYVRYAERSTPARYGIVILCFALGLMSKPVLVTLPCVLLLVDFWPLHRIRSAKQQARGKSAEPGLRVVPLKRALLEKLPLLVLSLVSSLVTIAGHTQLGTMISEEEFPLGDRVANAIVSYGRYLLKAVWPANLSVYYPMPASWEGWQIALSFVVVMSITIAVLALRKRAPYLAVGWLWFVGALVPTIGIIQASTQAMADRFAYLPIIGFFVAIVWGCDDWLRRFGPQRARLAVAAAVVALIGASAVTWHQLGYWQDSRTLFSHALAVTRDNAVAQANLGSALEEAGHREEALTHFREAIRLKPQSPQAYNNLGNVLDDMGRFGEAVAAYREALKLRPGVALVHNNLGFTLARQGQYEEARTNFMRAIELQPQEPHAYYLMGTLDLRMGDPRAAVSAFETALHLNANHVRALTYLARVLAASDDASIRNGTQAVQLAERAAVLTGQERPAILDTLAMAYAEAGRFDEAVKAAQAARGLLNSSNALTHVSEAMNRLALYQAHQPYRESATNVMVDASMPWRR